MSYDLLISKQMQRRENSVQSFEKLRQVWLYVILESNP